MHLWSSSSWWKSCTEFIPSWKKKLIIHPAFKMNRLQHKWIKKKNRTSGWLLAKEALYYLLSLAQWATKFTEAGVPAHSNCVVLRVKNSCFVQGKACPLFDSPSFARSCAPDCSCTLCLPNLISFIPVSPSVTSINSLVVTESHLDMWRGKIVERMWFSSLYPQLCMFVTVLEKERNAID